MGKKKTIILKESELIGLIESTVNDMQEQTSYDIRFDQEMKRKYGPTKEELEQREVEREKEKKRKARVNKGNNPDRVIAIAEMIYAGGILDQDKYWSNFRNGSVHKYYPDNYEITQDDINWYTNTAQPEIDEHLDFIEKGRKGFCADWWHCVLPVLEIGALFIPVVGIFVALGIGLLDAAIYYEEGDKKMAGLVGFLSLLPGIGAVAKRLTLIKVLGKEGMEKLAVKAINNPKSLSKLEVYLFKGIEANKSLINKSLNKELKQKLLTVDGKAIKILPNSLKGTLKDIFGGVVLYGGAGVGEVAVQTKVASKGHMGPKELLKTKGIEPKNTISPHKIVDIWPEDKADNPTYWEFFNYMFKSSKTAVDGEKMVQAILKGDWDPLAIWGGSTIVPKKYRTANYKKWANDAFNNEDLKKQFMSDGSDKENDLLLKFITANADWITILSNNIPEEYQTKAYKKRNEEDSEMAKENMKYWDELGLE